MGGKAHREGVDVDPRDVCSEALRAFLPLSTSRPSPQEFLDAYEAAAASGASAVVSVHISSEMSGTCQSARLAAEQAPIPVEVVDSRSLGMAMGFGVLSAAEAAGDGLSAPEVAEVARVRAAGAKVAFYVDTLEYLRRGGRIGSASALLGSAFAIKPILTLVDGAIRPLEKVRTSSRALARLTELDRRGGQRRDRGRRQGGHRRAAPGLGGAGRRRSRRRCGSGFRRRGLVVVAELGAVVGAHVGPGTLAAVASPRPRYG